MDKEKKENELFTIHFIEAHDERRQFNFTASLRTKDKIYEREKINENRFKYFDSLSYVSCVYRFKILFIKNFEVLIQLHENKDNIKNVFENVVSLKLNKKIHNIFIYNIQFKSKNGEFSHSPLNSANTQFPLNFIEELQLYKTVITELYNNEPSIYNDYLYYIFQIFVGNKKFNFTYYISGLLECYNNLNYASNYLMTFKFPKISEKGEPNKEQLQLFREKINEFSDDPNIILQNIKKEDQNKALDYLNAILLYFNYCFQKEKIDPMFKSTDINKALFKIIKTNPDIFPYFFLSKNQITKIIKASNKLSEIKEILFYSKNSLEFLEILNENKEHILNIYIIEKNDGNKFNESLCIKIDNNSKLKEDDDLTQIFQLLENIITFEIEKDSLFFIISDDFFQKIISFSNDLNYNRLLLVKNTIDNYIKKVDKNFKIKNLDMSIHQTGMKFINIGKIKTNEILDFIQKDKYYTDKLFEKSSERDINILKNIKIEEIDQKFLEKWNHMEWTKIFKRKEQEFYDIICSLSRNLSDFNKLFKLLYEQKKIDKSKVLISMQNEFLKKSDNCSLDELDDNSDIISNLIYYSDKDNTNINKFLNNLQEKINQHFLRKLYIKIISNNKDISNSTKKKLTTFIELDKYNYERIIDTIKHLNKNNEKNFAKIKDYIIEEKDFLNIKDTFNMTLLKKLISKEIIQEKPEQNNIFIESTLAKLNSLKEKIMLADFTYKDISFFCEEENYDLFLKRICLIYLIKEEDIPKLKNDPKPQFNECVSFLNLIREKYNKYKEMLTSLQLIFDDYSIFYPNSGIKKMNEINKLINEIKNIKLSEIYIKFHNKANLIISQDLKGVEERIKLKESTLFLSILFKEKSNYRDDDSKIFNEAKDIFFKLKELFDENGINYSNEKMLEFYIKEFNYLSDKEIKDEMIRIMDIFNVNIEKEKKEEAIYNIILLSKNKDRILSVSNAIITFIEEAGAIK